MPAAILAILQSVTAALIAKGPPAVHEKLSASRSLQRDLESEWNEARQTMLAENSAFDALVDQEKLSRVVFKQALDPYGLTGPENRQLELAVRTGWVGEPLAEKAATIFFVHFVESWKHKKSFAACAQWFEQLKGNELLEAIHEAIVSALEGVPVKAAPIPAPSATVLLQYCKRLAAPDIGNCDVRMKAEHVKTPETTEEVSSDGVEKRAERHKSQRSAPFAGEKPMADWKKDLQICGTGGKSRKAPRRSWARNHMGNVSSYQLRAPLKPNEVSS